MRFLILILGAAAMAPAQPRPDPLDFLNHHRPVPDAHNCYPYDGKWTDRIDRALRSGYPIAIEQDIAWYVDPVTGKGRPVVTHSARTTGGEPSLRDYFFERVRSIVEYALARNDGAHWPLIILHFDFKSLDPVLLRSVWNLLGDYQSWITTAPQTAGPHELAPLDPKPLLVLTEDADIQEQVFFREIPKNLRLFGSAKTAETGGKTKAEKQRLAATMPPEQLLSGRPTNYRRWWNNPWGEVEEGGQAGAGEWTPAARVRLEALVNHAHRLGYWIRFYTLDGFAPEDGRGWEAGYNFGSRERVEARWEAALEAGVDLIASDQYEDLAAFMKERHYR